MSNIKIDLKPLFEKLADKQYCIIKLPDEFPEYKLGSDLDMFCYDVEDISRVILGHLQNIISSSLTIKVVNNGSQIYIDLMDNSKIHFRFDLYGTLPTYENILIKEAFFASVIENTQMIEVKECKVKVPSLIDESILRYIEYQEWYGQRPDKIKHIEYLEHKIKEENLDINQLFDKLHYYTELPKIRENRQVSSSGLLRYVSYLFEMLKKLIKLLRKKGFKETISLVMKKIGN